MNLCQATALRIYEYLEKQKITLYRLEQNSGICHGTMYCILNNENKNISLRTIALLARGLNVSVDEFLDTPAFKKAFEEVE